MEFMDGQLVDCLWFSLTEPEKASTAYEVAEFVVKLSEVNLGGIGCLTVKDNLGLTVEGFELFRGRVSLPYLCQGCVNTQRKRIA